MKSNFKIKPSKRDSCAFFGILWVNNKDFVTNFKVRRLPIDIFLLIVVIPIHIANSYLSLTFLLVYMVFYRVRIYVRNWRKK